MITTVEAQRRLLNEAQAIARCGQELKKIPEPDYQGGNISIRLPEDFPQVRGGQRVALGNFYFERRQSFLITRTGGQYWAINQHNRWDSLVLVQTEPGLSPFYWCISLSEKKLAPTRELLAHLSCYMAWQKRTPTMRAVIHYHPAKFFELSQRMSESELRDFFYSDSTVNDILLEGFGFIRRVYEAGETGLALETGRQMKQGYRVVLWNQHGPIVIEQSLDKALKLIKLFA